ncbi:hypothetical protein ACVMHR_008202 [Bradyrhizobium diazoefficiens]
MIAFCFTKSIFARREVRVRAIVPKYRGSPI